MAEQALRNLERDLRVEFDAEESRWDREDRRRLETMRQHKQRMLDRLELQQRSGQPISARQIELATSAPTTQLELPRIVRRSLRNGEYAFHGANYCRQGMRTYSSSIPSRLIESAVECTFSPTADREPSRRRLLQRRQGLFASLPSQDSVRAVAASKARAGGAGLTAEPTVLGPTYQDIESAKRMDVLDYFRGKTPGGSSSRRDEAPRKPAFDSSSRVRGSGLGAEKPLTMELLTTGGPQGRVKTDLLYGLLMREFDPADMANLVDQERQSGAGRRIEADLRVFTNLEDGNVSMPSMHGFSSRGRSSGGERSGRPGRRAANATAGLTGSSGRVRDAPDPVSASLFASGATDMQGCSQATPAAESLSVLEPGRQLLYSASGGTRTLTIANGSTSALGFSAKPKGDEGERIGSPMLGNSPTRVFVRSSQRLPPVEAPLVDTVPEPLALGQAPRLSAGQEGACRLQVQEAELSGGAAGAAEALGTLGAQPTLCSLSLPQILRANRIAAKLQVSGLSSVQPSEYALQKKRRAMEEELNSSLLASGMLDGLGASQSLSLSQTSRRSLTLSASGELGLGRTASVSTAFRSKPKSGHSVRFAPGNTLTRVAQNDERIASPSESPGRGSSRRPPRDFKAGDLSGDADDESGQDSGSFENSGAGFSMGRSAEFSANFGGSEAGFTLADFDMIGSDTQGAGAGPGRLAKKSLPPSHPSHMIAEFEAMHGLGGL